MWEGKQSHSTLHRVSRATAARVIERVVCWVTLVRSRGGGGSGVWS